MEKLIKIFNGLPGLNSANKRVKKISLVLYLTVLFIWIFAAFFMIYINIFYDGEMFEKSSNTIFISDESLSKEENKKPVFKNDIEILEKENSDLLVSMPSAVNDFVVERSQFSYAINDKLISNVNRNFLNLPDEGIITFDEINNFDYRTKLKKLSKNNYGKKNFELENNSSIYKPKKVIEVVPTNDNKLKKEESNKFFDKTKKAPSVEKRISLKKSIKKKNVKKRNIKKKKHRYIRKKIIKRAVKKQEEKKIKSIRKFSGINKNGSLPVNLRNDSAKLFDMNSEELKKERKVLMSGYKNYSSKKEVIISEEGKPEIKIRKFKK